MRADNRDFSPTTWIEFQKSFVFLRFITLDLDTSKNLEGK